MLSTAVSYAQHQQHPIAAMMIMFAHESVTRCMQRRRLACRAACVCPHCWEAAALNSTYFDVHITSQLLDLHRLKTFSVSSGQRDPISAHVTGLVGRDFPTERK